MTKSRSRPTLPSPSRRYGRYCYHKMRPCWLHVGWLKAIWVEREGHSKLLAASRTRHLWLTDSTSSMSRIRPVQSGSPQSALRRPICNVAVGGAVCRAFNALLRDELLDGEISKHYARPRSYRTAASLYRDPITCFARLSRFRT